MAEIDYSALSEMLEEGILNAYERTSFRSPSMLERSFKFVDTDDGVSFTVNNYAQFLDEGTRYIKAQPFITPIIEDADTIEAAVGVEIDKRLGKAFTE